MFLYLYLMVIVMVFVLLFPPLFLLTSAGVLWMLTGLLLLSRSGRLGLCQCRRLYRRCWQLHR